MKSRSTLKNDLTSDNLCCIESNIKDNTEQEEEHLSSIIIQPQGIISTASNIINDYSNNSDLLSVSKTDSNISVFSAFQQKDKDKDSSSNLFISFSNISEADPKQNGDSSINLNVSSNSIVCKREPSQIQKCSSLTPSTICNYYLHSNDVTPNKPVDPNMFNQSIKQTNLNLVYNSMNSNSAIEDKETNFFQGKEVSNSNKKNIFIFQQDKRTPIKYTKSQLKHNESDTDIEGGKKNLMVLFNEGDDLSNNNINFSQPGDFFSHIKIKDNTPNIVEAHIIEPSKIILQVEKINNFMIENIIANNHQKGMSFPLSPNNYSNFSFDITRNNNNILKSSKQDDLNMNNPNEEKKDTQIAVIGSSLNNQVISIKKEVPFKQNIDPNINLNSNLPNHLNWPSNNSYVSPKFMNGPKLAGNDSTTKASTLTNSNSGKKTQKTIESNNSPDSATNKNISTEHNKYISSFTLPTNPKNKSPQINKGNLITTKRTDSIINLDQQKHLKSHSISPKANTPKHPMCATKTVKRNLSFLRHYNTTIRSRSNSASKSRSKDKQNSSNNSNKNETSKLIHKPKYINKTQLNLDVKSTNRPNSCTKQGSIKNEQLSINIIQKIKEKTSSNLINFINTLKPSSALKDTLIKARISPSPPQKPIKTKTAHINLTNLLNKNIVEHKKPLNNNQPICSIQSALQKLEDNQSLNSTKLINNSRLSTNGKESVSNTVISTQKKQAKIIQNFSNYKKKTSYEKHFVAKKGENNQQSNSNSNRIKSIISNKLQRPGGDDNLNILIEEF